VTEPGDRQYAWQELDESGWGVIYAMVPLLGYAAQLMHRNPDITREVLGPIARQHVARTGNRLRLVQLDVTRVLQEVEPPTSA